MRHRTYQKVVENIKRSTKFFRGWPHFFFIVDSYFGVHRQKSKELLKQIIENGVKAHFFTLARCEIAEDSEMLTLMRQAGVKFIFMGIESIDNNTLDHFDKGQTIEKVKKSVGIIRRYGIHVCGSFVLGSDNDPSDTWIKTVEFAKEAGLTWIMLNVLTDFQSGQGELSLPLHRIFQKDWDYYNTHFIVHYPRNIRPSELEQGAYDAYRLFYSWTTIFSNLFKGRIEAAFYQWYKRLLVKSLLREMKAYVPYLKQVEEGLYDESGHLLEERLVPLAEMENTSTLKRPFMEKDHEVVLQVA
jgi:radical SAM superfamily enzyme YgiQ (UPF0313 family)